MTLAEIFTDIIEGKANLQEIPELNIIIAVIIGLIIIYLLRNSK